MKKTWTGLLVALFSFSALFGCKKKAVAAPKNPKSLYKIAHKKLTVQKGKDGTAGFAIKLVKGSKVHPKAPFVCQVTSSAGLTVKKKTLKHPDTKSSRDKKTKLMTVSVNAPIAAKATGKQNVKMDCAFFICTKDLCMRTTEKINIKGSVN